MPKMETGRLCLVAALATAGLVYSLGSPSTVVETQAQPARLTEPGPPGVRSNSQPAQPVEASDYPWLADSSDSGGGVVSLTARFEPPSGFQRVPVANDSFAAWLRGLPLRTDRTQVLSYDGTPLNRPSAAVVFMDTGDRNLMQCADSLIRLHAEFLWSRERADEAGYRFTSGDLSRWSDWRDGERFQIHGNKVERSTGPPRANNHKSFRRWLDLVFTYAGTASLARDAVTISATEELHAGNFFVEAGFPGHAVLVLDIAQDRSGRKVALVAQGFMPAEDVHVLRSSAALDGYWFPLPQTPGEVLDTPSWAAFPRSAARRFP